MQTEPAEASIANDDLIWRWHDNLIYGISFDIGDVEKQEWRSDLVFDIDYIAEWICGPEGGIQFRVAPATLVFHDAGDLSIAIEFGDSIGRTALSELSIDRLTRERLDHSVEMWRWTIHLNTPPGGKISFAASRFTQTSRAEPRLVSDQRLPRSDR